MLSFTKMRIIRAIMQWPLGKQACAGAQSRYREVCAGDIPMYSSVFANVAESNRSIYLMNMVVRTTSCHLALHHSLFLYGRESFYHFKFGGTPLRDLSARCHQPQKRSRCHSTAATADWRLVTSAAPPPPS